MRKEKCWELCDHTLFTMGSADIWMCFTREGQGRQKRKVSKKITCKVSEGIVNKKMYTCKIDICIHSGI